MVICAICDAMRKSLKSISLLISLLAVLTAPLSLIGAEKTVITEADQLPRVASPFSGNVVDLFQDADLLKPYLEKVGAEIERIPPDFLGISKVV